MHVAELNEKGRLDIAFRSSDRQQFFDMLSKVKSLPDRKFEKDKKIWTAPNIKLVRDSLREWGFEVAVNESEVQVELDDADDRLYDFQVEGLRKIIQLKGRCLLSMDMGLGKTATSLNFLRIRPDQRPAVIVVPASVKLNWYREIKLWMEYTEESIVIMQGKQHYPCKGASIIIINYDILEAHVEYLIKLKPKVLIVDEVQFVKNETAKRTKAAKKLSRTVPYMIGLSGTPIMNRPAEFWPILNMLKPTVWGNRMSYLFRYCAPKNNGFGWTYKGATNTRELNEILNQEIMYRVLKHDVLTQLPDKVYSVIPFTIDMRREYRSAEFKLRQFMQGATGRDSAEALARIGAMRDAAARSKMDHVIEWVKDFLETDEKLVLFAIHHKIIDQLMDVFGPKIVKLDGRDNLNQREQSIQKFRTDPKVRLFIGNIQAAGVGVNGLQDASSNVAFVELDWVPAALDQASDRLHRVGQKDSVNVYYLIAENTIEEEMASAIDEKRKVLDAVLDGKETSEDSMILRMLSRYRNE